MIEVLIGASLRPVYHFSFPHYHPQLVYEWLKSEDWALCWDPLFLFQRLVFCCRVVRRNFFQEKNSKSPKRHFYGNREVFSPNLTKIHLNFAEIGPNLGNMRIFLIGKGVVIAL